MEGSAADTAAGADDAVEQVEEADERYQRAREDDHAEAAAFRVTPGRAVVPHCCRCHDDLLFGITQAL
jgi:cytochrome c5